MKKTLLLATGGLVGLGWFFGPIACAKADAPAPPAARNESARTRSFLPAPDRFSRLDGRLAHLQGRAHPVHRLGPGGA